MVDSYFFFSDTDRWEGSHSAGEASSESSLLQPSSSSSSWWCCCRWTVRQHLPHQPPASCGLTLEEQYPQVVFLFSCIHRFVWFVFVKHRLLLEETTHCCLLVQLINCCCLVSGVWCTFGVYWHVWWIQWSDVSFGAYILLTDTPCVIQLRSWCHIGIITDFDTSWTKTLGILKETWGVSVTTWHSTVSQSGCLVSRLLCLVTRVLCKVNTPSI